VHDRADIVEGARREGDAIVKKAEERARVLVSEQEVVRQSQQKDAEIMQSAQQNAKDLRNSVNNYCENILRQTEEQLLKSCADVKKVRASVKQKERRPIQPQEREN